MVDVTRPGIMISQIAPNTRERQGETVRILESMLEHEFFASVQTVEIPYSLERRAFAALVRDRKLQYTYCLARVLNENQLNLSDLDRDNRSKSVEAVIRALDDALEAGAHAVTLISGPRPADPRRRKEALKALEQSLYEIGFGSSDLQPITIEIEPLDYDSHKTNTLGTSADAFQLCQTLLSRGQETYLCLDTAHMLLNDEKPMESLRLCMPFTKEYHFCNCVLDQDHPLFGDRHLPFGRPGVLEERGIGLLMRDAVECGFFNAADKPLVMCEVLNQSGRDPAAIIGETRSLLKRAWESSLQREAQ